jgi:NTE family protein
MVDSTRSPGTPAIRRPPTGEPEGPRAGVGLCLSGGGFRAMLFHVGSLWRLSEAGYLPRLERVSSVSGGSITAGVLASNWTRLSFDGQGRVGREVFEEAVANPLRRFADRTIDVPSVLVGILTPRVTVNDRLARAYRRLVDDRTLAELPNRPEFVLDATNLQSGDLWRFSSLVEGDFRVGTRANPDTALARVIAASSAFPPFLSPARLTYAPGILGRGDDDDVNDRPYTTRVMLSDGGVYDNLGLEAVWTTCEEVLISDAGGRINATKRVSALWPMHVLRVLKVIDNQVRDLRKRQAVLSYSDGQRSGAYWGIRSHVRDFPITDPVALPSDKTVAAVAGVATRLAKLAPDMQRRLINWGYVMCDTALRSHVVTSEPAGTLPYPDAPL